MRCFLMAGLLGLVGASEATAQKYEVMLAGTTHATRRALVTGAATGRASGTMSGGEFMARFDGAGVYLRHLSGGFATRQAPGAEGDLTLTDARFLIGPQAFNIEVGYLRRDLGNVAGERPRDLWRAGARIFLDLGPSGFGVFVAGSAIIRFNRTTPGGPPETSANVQVAGSEGETGVVYQAPNGWPFFARLGYRFARFDEFGPTDVLRQESLSGVILSAGIRWLP